MTVSNSFVREFLWIVKESALGTRFVTPTPGTDSIYIRLSEGDLSMMEVPIIDKIPYGGGLAINAQAITDHYETKGGFKTKLYPSQAAFLMGWAMGRINSGMTVPWSQTSEPPGDLASCTVYHGVMRADGTIRRKKFKGCKVAGATFDISRQSTTGTLSLDLIGGQAAGSGFDGTSDPNATEFPLPVETDFPLISPYTFTMTAGGFTVDSVRTQYEDLSFKVVNALDARWFEGSYVTVLKACGRATTLDATIYLKASPDDRSPFENLTAATVSLVLTNGVSGQNMTIQCNTNNYRTSLPYQLPMNQAYALKLSLETFWDAAANSGAGGDFQVTFA